MNDAREEVERALDHPPGSQKIEELAAPGMDVVISFDDLQRPTPADVAIPRADVAIFPSGGNILPSVGRA